MIIVSLLLAGLALAPRIFRSAGSGAGWEGSHAALGALTAGGGGGAPLKISGGGSNSEGAGGLASSMGIRSMSSEPEAGAFRVTAPQPGHLLEPAGGARVHVAQFIPPL